MKEKKWWENGVRFECQGSGRCCVARDDYGYVYVTLTDRKRLAKHFKIPTKEFTEKFCEKGEEAIWRLKDFTKACRFLEKKGCSVYESRPTQCRTWPFWPEVMSARSWKIEVASFCPGVGKRRLLSKSEIEKQLLQQSKSEEKY